MVYSVKRRFSAKIIRGSKYLEYKCKRESLVEISVKRGGQVADVRQDLTGFDEDNELLSNIQAHDFVENPVESSRK